MKKRLILTKETLKTMKIKTDVRGGIITNICPSENNCATDTCDPTSNQGASKLACAYTQ